MSELKNRFRSAALVVSFTLLPGFGGAVYSADSSTHSDVAAAGCTICHGPKGHSPGAIPSLTDLSPEELAKRMAAFRDGTAQNTIMSRLAKGFTDAEIAQLATTIAGWN